MTDQTQTVAPTVTAVTQPRQNDVLRPFPGTKTGLVWDYADALLAARKDQKMEHAVPLVSEVQALYSNVIDAVPSTCRQQFAFWLKFNGLKPEWQARIAAEGNSGDAEKQAKKAEAEKKKLERLDAAKTKAEERQKKQAASIEKQLDNAKARQAKAEAAVTAAKEKADAAYAKAKAAADAAAAKAAALSTPTATTTETAPVDQQPADTTNADANVDQIAATTSKNTRKAADAAA